MVFSQENIVLTYKLLCSGGNRIRTGKRNQLMYQYGGTIGPSKYPTFKLDSKSSKKQMLPRPFVKSRPFQLGHVFMTNCAWLYDLCQHVEQLTINYLLSNRTQSTVSVLDHIRFSKEHVHPSLRICDTFFTQMILIGCFKSTEGSIPPH